MPLDNGALLIDDSYNANPGSVAAAIDSLAAACALDKRQSVLVLGDMAELGETAEVLHAQIGSAAKTQGIDALYTCGRLSAATSAAFGPQARHFNTRDELILALKQNSAANQRILVKGSRSSRMDEIVNALVLHFGLKENTDAA
jgi:UDP-N-acetylmuramoyl-tripeptide--D-alanyl-D-alanine ligase